VKNGNIFCKSNQYYDKDPVDLIISNEPHKDHLITLLPIGIHNISSSASLIISSKSGTLSHATNDTRARASKLARRMRLPWNSFHVSTRNKPSANRGAIIEPMTSWRGCQIRSGIVYNPTFGSCSYKAVMSGMPIATDFCVQPNIPKMRRWGSS